MSARTPRVTIRFNSSSVELSGRKALEFLTWYRSSVNAHKYVGFSHDGSRWNFTTFMNRGRPGTCGDLSKGDLKVDTNVAA